MTFSPGIPAVCQQFHGRRALVVGDVMLDRYILGAVSRISPEAPVPVVSRQREWSCPGGAGNVAALLAALGCHVTLVGVVGCDIAGRELRKALVCAGVRDIHLGEDEGVQTITKTRILASDQHQLLRLDVDGDREDRMQVAQRLLPSLVPRVATYDVMCLADYDKGTLPPSFLCTLIEQARAAGVPCLVDPKKPDLFVYQGAGLLAPNLIEAERALKRSLHSELLIEAAALQLREQLHIDAMIITRGADGMTVADAEGVHRFPAEVRQVADVAGAGDTVMATLAAALAARWPLRDACRLASVAAGIAVSKPGVAVVTAGELNRAWGGGTSKLMDWNAAREQVQQAQKEGRKVVFTNGCFDMLHAGHLHSLEQARHCGDLLVVGLNSDHSVKSLKGESRPIIKESDRATLLGGLSCVDIVVLFDELTPEALIRTLAPDVLVKGGDYDPATIAGADFVRARGGKVLIIPLLPGLSTTQIVEKSRAGS